MFPLLFYLFYFIHLIFNNIKRFNSLAFIVHKLNAIYLSLVSVSFFLGRRLISQQLKNFGGIIKKNSDHGIFSYHPCVIRFLILNCLICRVIRFPDLGISNLADFSRFAMWLMQFHWILFNYSFYFLGGVSANCNLCSFSSVHAWKLCDFYLFLCSSNYCWCPACGSLINGKTIR